MRACAPSSCSSGFSGFSRGHSACSCGYSSDSGGSLDPGSWIPQPIRASSWIQR